MKLPIRLTATWRRNSAPTATARVENLGDPQRGVMGDDLLLITDPAGAMRLYSTADGEARALGDFTDVRSAWAAVDAIDLAKVDAQLDADQHWFARAA